MSASTMEIQSQTPFPTTASTTTSNFSSQPETLLVDFTWRKFRTLISTTSSPDKSLYTIKYNALSPHLEFFHGTPDESKTAKPFGTGNVHAVSINCECLYNDKHIELHAQKKLKIQYQHLSPSFPPRPSPSTTSTSQSPVSTTEFSKPVELEWTAHYTLKTWTFTCTEVSTQTPLAKFTANIWALKKIGRFEFGDDERLRDRKVQEELIVAGLTVFYCVVFRSGNFLSLFGAVFAKPNLAGEEGEDGI